MLFVGPCRETGRKICDLRPPYRSILGFGWRRGFSDIGNLIADAFLDSNILLYACSSAIGDAALELGCKIFYMEDINDGQEYNGVRIVNPFR